MTCTLMIDALATVQAVGVTREGHVTGMVRDVPLEPKVAKAICSDREAFRQFVGEQVAGHKVTGALFVFVLTLDVPGCPPGPVCVLRRAHRVADDEVLDRSREILAMTAGMGVGVTRVATDGDREFTIWSPAPPPISCVTPR
jgi:Ni,Fe-hydrogenase III small subunit